MSKIEMGDNRRSKSQLELQVTWAKFKNKETYGTNL